MKKILLLEWKPAIYKEYLQYLEQDFALIEKNEIDKTYKRDEIVGIVVRSATQVTQELINQYVNLKYVLRVWIGVDNIDVKYCEQKNIKVINTPGANADAVADLTLWWTLSLLRRTKLVHNNLTTWICPSRFTYMWNELNSQNVGIVWFGNIGKKVYQRLRGFVVQKFFVYDPFLDCEEVEKNVYCKYMTDIDEMIVDVDILYLHLPLNSHTRNFIDMQLLKTET